MPKKSENSLRASQRRENQQTSNLVHFYFTNEIQKSQYKLDYNNLKATHLQIIY